MRRLRPTEALVLDRGRHLPLLEGAAALLACRKCNCEHLAGAIIIAHDFGCAISARVQTRQHGLAEEFLPGVAHGLCGARDGPPHDFGPDAPTECAAADDHRQFPSPSRLRERLSRLTAPLFGGLIADVKFGTNVIQPAVFALLHPSAQDRLCRLLSWLVPTRRVFSVKRHRVLAKLSSCKQEKLRQ